MQKSGLYQIYNGNGLSRIIANFKDDLPHGTYKRWHNNGVLAEEGIYKNGERTFMFRYWNNITKKLDCADTYHNDDKGFTRTLFYANGNYRKMTNYRIIGDGYIRIGPQLFWNFEGERTLTRSFSESGDLMKIQHH